MAPDTLRVNGHGPSMYSSEDAPGFLDDGSLSHTPLTDPNTQQTSQGPPRPQVDAQGRTLNPRSCVTCRKRKVKCDKTHPCSNCNRAHIECVFPSPGRAPRKVRKLGNGKDKELLERLRRLEGVVKGLGVDGLALEEGEGNKSSPEGVNGNGATIRRESSGDQLNSASIRDRDRDDDTPSSGDPRQQWSGRDSNSTARSIADRSFEEKTRWVEENQIGRFENRFGRLVVNEGRSRYINNSFWANLSNEVEDLKGILNEPSDEDEDEPSPGGTSTQIVGNHQGWIFGFSSQNVDLLSLHPLPSQIETYWQVYKDNVDPLVKVLHIPTIEQTVLSAASHLSNLSKGFETLLFALYYGATTSLCPEDCYAKLGEEKSVLLARYRFAIEQALARANFLTTEEIIVLQAFVIFLICLRRNNDARVIWTLTGLVVRIAQTIGIHRDGLHFGLAPFEIEMRRRLWWQVCILDTRASEDHGCDPTIVEQSFDTKMPLNINDVDISPEMKEFPAERTGCTDISFCLIRFEVANTFRRINYIPPGPARCTTFFVGVSLADKERWITECHARLEDRYLKHCDMSVPLFWVTATVARLMMSKMWLMVYHPFQRKDGGASLPTETKDKLFITSLENIEYSILLETEARTMKWGWLFKTYIQWHALAFILSELCHRTTGDLVERAWVAVEKTKDGRWNLADQNRTGHLWRPLKKLYRKAKEARAMGMQEEQMVKIRNNSLPGRTYSPNPNPMYDNASRPRMTRAPLSKAQIERFSKSPVYGDQPLDSHELLRSPDLSVAASDDLMDTTGLTADGAQLSVPRDVDKVNIGSLKRAASEQFLDVGGFESNGWNTPLKDLATSMAPARQHIQTAFGTTQPPGHVFDPKFMPMAPNINNNTTTNTSNFDMGNLDWNNLQDPSSGMADEQLLLDSDMMDMMDAGGDLNWENWDQLVRQFGTDAQTTPGATGQAANWAGPNWDIGTMGPQLARGFGLGGDQF